MPTFLHIGCGPKHKVLTTRGFNIPDWTEIRLDIDASIASDVISTMTNMSALAPESVDELLTEAAMREMTGLHFPA